MGSGAAATGVGTGAAAGASSAGAWAWAACLLAICPPTTAAVPTTAVVRTAIRAIGRLLIMSNLLSSGGSDCRRQVSKDGCDELMRHASALEQDPIGPPDRFCEGSRPDILPDQQRSRGVRFERGGSV